jgi:mevalonate kinase
MCFHRRISCTVQRGGDRLVVHAPGVFEPPVDLPATALASVAPPDPRLALLWPILRAHAEGGVQLRFEAGFPATWGLGSSSASTLAAAAALAGTGGRQRFVEVRAAQRALQGSASGYDAATQLLGGYVLYRDGDPADLQPVRPGGAPAWVVAWTGTCAGTAPMIRQVRERFAPGHPLYTRIGALAEQGAELIREADLTGLGAALNEGHGLLCELGAVPDEPAAIVRALQADPDVLGARMSGAGGGDCILILAADPTYAAAAARGHGLEVLDLEPEPEGLRIEEAA